MGSPATAQAGGLSLHMVRRVCLSTRPSIDLEFYNEVQAHLSRTLGDTGLRAIPGVGLTELDVIIYGLISLINVAPGHYKNISGFQADRYFYEVFVH